MEDHSRRSGTKVLVFIPSYNDPELVGALCNEVCALGAAHHVLVVDDGSDRPVEGDKLPPRSRVFRLPANYGLGVATLIAADHMIVGGYDVLVRVDADGQHPVAMISRLVARVERGVDLCVGIRTNAGSVSGLRARLAGAVRAYYRVVGGMLVGRLAAADLTSGFMAFSRRAAAAVARWDLDRYPEPEIVLLAHRHGLVIDAVPIEQAERQFGRSTISLRRGVLLFYRFNMFVLGQLLDRVRLK